MTALAIETGAINLGQGFPDTDGPASMLDAARQAIRALNERSRAARAQGDGAPGGDRFFLLHRERLWNEAQGVWMGWERKRKVLAEIDRTRRLAA